MQKQAPVRAQQDALTQALQKGNMARLHKLVLTIAGATLLASCSRGADHTPHQSLPQPSASSVIEDASAPPESWLGPWIGPEGTSLLLSRTSTNRYDITIRSLDGVATYPGVWAHDEIEFTRAGQAEHIRAGTGRDTGMKWLLEKNNCLVIRLSEGFCRG
jgi:hypothetical protein